MASKRYQTYFLLILFTVIGGLSALYISTDKDSIVTNNDVADMVISEVDGSLVTEGNATKCQRGDSEPCYDFKTYVVALEDPSDAYYQIGKNLNSNEYGFSGDDSRYNSLFADTEGTLKSLQDRGEVVKVSYLNFLESEQDKISTFILNLMGGGLFGEYYFLENPKAIVHITVHILDKETEAEQAKLKISLAPLDQKGANQAYDYLLDNPDRVLLGIAVHEK